MGKLSCVRQDFFYTENIDAKREFFLDKSSTLCHNTACLFILNFLFSENLLSAYGLSGMDTDAGRGR